MYRDTDYKNMTLLTPPYHHNDNYTGKLKLPLDSPTVRVRYGVSFVSLKFVLICPASVIVVLYLIRYIGPAIATHAYTESEGVEYTYMEYDDTTYLIWKELFEGANNWKNLGNYYT